MAATRARDLRTSPCSSAAGAHPGESRVELLREDIVALCGELTDELTRNPTVHPIGADRATVYRLLSAVRM